MAGHFRIFLSAVTSEFRRARDELAADLRSRDTLVRVQSDFRQEAGSDTTLKKLHDYIRDCSSVVCIIGARSGACPPPAAAAPFRAMLPSGIREASYTQWEFFFARHYRRRLSIYIARPDYEPDEPTPAAEDSAHLQQAFVHHIVTEHGLDRDYFSSIHELARAVLKEDWPRKLPIKLIVLPYPSLGKLFKGRAGLITRLHNTLSRAGGGKAAIASQVLYGLGGIGKTRAAVEYAWTHQQEYTALLFVVAEAPQALRRNLAGLTVPLLLPEREANEEELRLRAVLDWLKANPGWLLILDNVDTPQALAEAEKLMGQLTGGQVVMTSRLANFPADIDPLELDVLTADDAADFLLERTAGRRRSTEDDATVAREFAVQALGQLPLALEHAGAYIVRNRSSFREYRELWLDSRERVMSWSDPTVTHYPRAIAATWQTSVAQLTEVARRLLEQLAWLAPEPVPEFLLKVPIPPPSRRHKFLGFNFALWKAPPQHIDPQALQELIAYSLATRHAVESQFSLHRLVQDVTRRSLDTETHRLRLEEALRWINAAFVGAPDEYRNSPRLEPLVPHARAVIRYAEDSGIIEPTVTLMTRLGVLLMSEGRHSEAEALHRRVLVLGEKSLGPDHPEMVFALNNLGLSLHATNRLAEAEPLLRRALAITEIKLGPKHPRVGVHLNNLALLLRDDGRPAEAESLMRRALAIDENSFGPDYPRVAAYLNNLGQLLRLTNHIAEAEPLLRRALAIEEKNFGPAHPNTAARMVYLGELLRANAQLVQAEPLLRRALAIEEESFGPDHPEVAICLTSLGELLRDTNRLREAEPLLRRAATIFADFEKRTGHRHPNHDAAERSYLSVLDPSGKPGSEAGRCRRRP